ncbi:MAG TPA: arsenite methyltransferase [Synergistaceae bacterium]|nr:arsenite methyltransferase [Synergistaceae bacterium]HPJ26315.1 arsenite methyltransferase [Synergistaceae bacterium]HPQ37295.1 arsenite methyltransferase [Synergistaceae bacterium]
MEDLRKKVQEKYARAIQKGTSCCSSGGCCCGGTNAGSSSGITEGNYSEEALQGAPGSAGSQSFGCGNPLEEARILPGETVLDLGSGAGLDLFLASQATGPTGRVIGLDMTEEMLATAKENLGEAPNVSLVKGYIEAMPLEDRSVDVIISNCVINLSPDKDAVLREAFRVLRPGGRFCVSDTVFLRPLSARGASNVAAWSGCIAGALLSEEYREKMEAAGFEDVAVECTKIYAFPDSLGETLFPELSPEERKELDGAFGSAIIRGKRPSR